MTIDFLKKDEGWVAEFEATADFNLHLEGVVEGNVNIYQRTTASGGYTLVRGATPYPSYSNVYDFDFSALVYPKFIKVVCPVQPSYAEVMSTGEVTELKYQSKAVEITENGTTSITPDAGFTALNAVEVKVNVPQSGEGGSALEYIDLFDADNFVMQRMVASAKEIKAYIESEVYIAPAGFVLELDSELDVRYVAIELDSPMNFNGEQITPRQWMKNGGIDENEINSLPRITKEEFYTLIMGGE